MRPAVRLLPLLALAPLALAARAFQSPTTPTGADAKPAAAAADPDARLRVIARMLVQVEGRHRTQVAELERLARVFGEERMQTELRLAIEARHLEVEDYRARLATFERDLGPELYARFRAAMDADPDREPALRPIPPEPPPPPEPLPHEIEQQDAEKRRTEEEGGGG